MKPLLVVCMATVLVALPSACRQSTDTHEADIQAIRDTEAQWNQDYLSRDPDKLAAYYSEDAVLMAPGMPAAAGKANIRSSIAALTSDPALSLKFQASKVDVAQSGDLGYTLGSYVMTLTNPQTKRIMHDYGSYVTTYRKGPDGKWKAVADIATSEIPPESSHASS